MYPVTERARALSLVAQGRSLNSVSKGTGISRAALREWRDRGLAPHTASPCCWVCECRPCETPAAYAALLGFYLGDGCISRAARAFFLRIACDRTYPGIIDDATSLMAAVKQHGRVGHVPAPGMIVVQSYWQHWPCVLPQHGPGPKHSRKLRLEDWQSDIVTEHPADFLRGLMHSEGSRVNNWTRCVVAGEMKRYDYPRWQFVNHSEDIRQWCCDALDLLAIPWRQSDWRTISVSTRAGVAMLDELVGPKA